MASAGRRGKELFNIVPAILPDMINILWILLLFVVMISEQKHLWNKETTIGMASIFFVNWIGIYAGFYMIFNIPTDSFDDLSGRYLHPFLVFFLPCLQNIGAKCEIKISKRSIRKIAVISTIFIFDNIFNNSILQRIHNICNTNIGIHNYILILNR